MFARAIDGGCSSVLYDGDEVIAEYIGDSFKRARKKKPEED
jgi:hypothetical protein